MRRRAAGRAGRMLVTGALLQRWGDPTSLPPTAGTRPGTPARGKRPQLSLLQLLQDPLQGLDSTLLRRLVARGPQGLECVLGVPQAVGHFAADHVQVEPAVAVVVEQADTELAPQGTQLGLLGVDLFEHDQEV